MASNIGSSIGNKKWFIGQVPPSNNQFSEDADWSESHGNRVKVRIPGIHPMSSEDALDLPDKDLPWAIVAQPTTSGNSNRISNGIWGGEWVIGFFIDDDCQIPVITQVLSNNLSDYEIRESENGTTFGKRVSRYHKGNPAGNHQIVSSSVVSQKQSKEETKSDFSQAKVGENKPGIISGVSWKGIGESITLDELRLIQSSNKPWVTQSIISDAETDAIRQGIITEKQRTV